MLADDFQGASLMLQFNSVPVALIEPDAIDSGEHLDFPRLSSDLNDEVFLKEILLSKSDLAEAEALENPDQLVRVPGTYGHEEINVARVARKPVDAHGIPSDDQVFNGLLSEQSDEFEKIPVQVIHHSGWFRKSPPWLRGVPRGCGFSKGSRDPGSPEVSVW
ncbi:hypothetical protein OKA05_22945 [Luteolibacter arcticus]|uniref:Uncharacterized protein n=1 Tax=Luteolibacter arcticus TaxID=1581411 RepID=A0ABT3GPJ0_9BACT|nr:hypothetical protein [Luteolibacter arcticus]MCW1925437.1 hypothetical protein [Luteolibacter arcticus]